MTHTVPARIISQPSGRSKFSAAIRGAFACLGGAAGPQWCNPRLFLAGVLPMRFSLDRHGQLVLGLLGVLLAVASGALWLSGGHTPAPPPPDRPRLAVVVIFDQMRGDYLQRWQELFGPDGFRRLQKDGAWFLDCHYPYAHTVTAAGHASVLTGCSPDRHGIVGNEWYDREAGASVYCVGSVRYEQVPPRQPGSRRTEGIAPELLLAPSLGDSLRETLGNACKVIGISFKDRAAVLPAGKSANLCLWFDGDTGLACTSTRYAERLPAWVAEFNASRPADRWFGQEWERLRPDVNYVRHSNVDDGDGEGNGFKQGRTFPHPMSFGLKAPGKTYYQALYNSPFGNELVLQLAKRAIDGEQLGADDHPDLLCISFSSNDSVGHTWGPDSQEVLDVTLRSDELIRELLAHLDAKVGRGRYLFAVTADHGVCPLPEVSRAEGRNAGRVSFRDLAVEAEDYLDRKYLPAGSRAHWFEDANHTPWFYLNRTLLRERKLDPAVIERDVARFLQTQPGVARAYTRTELTGPCTDDEDDRVWKSYHPGRCGDVVVVLKPYWIWAMPFLGGTNHGTPYAFDTHVPLLVYGLGIPAGIHKETVPPQAIPAIFAHRLGIPPPSTEVPVPVPLLEGAAASK
jgi:hypothetical protein